MGLTHPLVIGNLQISHPYIPAPMAGLTDIAFRRLLDDLGHIGYMVTEMISAEGLIRRNEKTLEMIRCDGFRFPQFIQLFGAAPKSIGEAVRIIKNETAFDGIDFNMGCPAPKVVKKGAGSALLKTPEQVKAVVKTLRKLSNKPLTVKLRLGYEKVNIFETLKIIEQEGADAVAVHFRLRSDFYRGEADWSYAEQIKDRLNIPFLGNGDIRDFKTARRRKKDCDGVMIGRYSLMNPMVFTEIAKNRSLPDRIRIFFPKLIRFIEESYPKDIQLQKLKPFVKYMISERPDSRHMRYRLYNSRSIEEAKEIFFKEIGDTPLKS